MHILVVDPSVPLAMLLSEELKRLKYDVTQCATSEQALAAAAEQKFDLAMMDMALEDPNTVTLAQKLREYDAEIRLALTPFMGEQPVLEDADILIQGVLPKPFFFPDLPSRIEAILSIPADASATAEIEPEPEFLPEPEPEPEPVVEPAIEPSAPAVKPEPAEVSTQEPVALDHVEEAGLSYTAFTKNRLQVERVMGNLAQELGADAVLLTYGGGLLTWVGGLTKGEAESISRAVVHGWRTSAQVARILGREQVRFEQSLTGSDYMLYALSVEVNAILAVAVRGVAPLGLLRHRARTTVEEISRLCVV